MKIYHYMKTIHLQITMKTSINSKIHMAEIERRLHKTCDQMSLLHNTIKTLQVHHKRAAICQHSLSQQSIKLRVEVLQSVYNMYYMYASRQAQLLITASTCQDN